MNQHAGPSVFILHNITPNMIIIGIIIILCTLLATLTLPQVHAFTITDYMDDNTGDNAGSDINTGSDSINYSISNSISPKTWEAKIISLRFAIPGNSTSQSQGISDTSDTYISSHINEDTKTIIVPVPEKADMRYAVPYVIISDGASIDFSDPDNESKEQYSELKEQYSTTYKVTSFDGTKQDYTIVISRESDTGSALFDIILDIVKEPDANDDNLAIKVSLINFGSKDLVDADLTYTIKDSSGTLIKKISKKIPVKTQMEFIDTIDTKEFPEGKYSLNVELKYPGQKYPAYTEEMFHVSKDSLKGIFRDARIGNLVLSISLIALLVFAYVRYRKYNRFREEDEFVNQ